MARQSHRLSAVKVASITKPGYHADGGNLYFRVAPSGARGWIFRYGLNGRKRDAGLGAYPTISLAKAREQATRFRQLVATGVDPIEQRDSERSTARAAAAKKSSFAECAAAYIQSHEDAWRHPRHQGQWVYSIERYVNPVIGHLPPDAIDTGLVLKIIEPLWKTIPETASRIRGRIEMILDWAKVRGHRGGENPARWRGHLAQILPPRSKVRTVEHFPALPYADAGAFMAELRADDNTAARALEFVILTVARTTEVLEATWDEIDRRERAWTLPPGRMKGGRVHRVPLSDAALAVVDAMAKTRTGAFIFPGQKAGASLTRGAMPRVLARLGRRDVTVHGFRSTFKDWASECTSFQNEVVEMALAHAIGDAVEAAYRRGDLFEKRRKLMEAWAEYCSRVDVGGGDVLQFTARG
jgi:integrase